MKFLFSIVKVVISIGLALGLLLALINQTFIYTVYKTDYMDDGGITMPRFVYMLDSSSDTKGDFITWNSKEVLEDNKNNYLNNLASCYGKYYYDQENDITILNYKITDNGLYRTVNIEYDTNNYCSDNYILSDTWIYEYKELSKIEEININEASMTRLIDILNNAKRNINPVVDDNYKSSKSINLLCSLKTSKYSLEIKDFSENEIVVIREEANKKKFAVYEVGNAKATLEGLI